MLKEKSQKILVVDDNEDARTILNAKIRRKLECEVVSVESAGEALNLLSEISVDCIISDVEMPGQSGLELARLLEGIDTPIFLYTGLDTRTLNLAEYPSVTDIFRKPDIDRLVEAVRKVLNLGLRGPSKDCE